MRTNEGGWSPATLAFMESAIRKEAYAPSLAQTGVPTARESGLAGVMRKLESVEAASERLRAQASGRLDPLLRQENPVGSPSDPTPNDIGPAFASMQSTLSRIEANLEATLGIVNLVDV